MEHILNEKEVKELHDEYFSIADKIRELKKRQQEIDSTINRNSCNIVASKYIPLEFGDKIRVTRKVWRWANFESETIEGFFGSFFLDGHQYTVDNGVNGVGLRLYQIKKDGTRSQRFEDIHTGNIVSIEKVAE